jgi:hypothetical protein
VTFEEIDTAIGAIEMAIIEVCHRS